MNHIDKMLFLVLAVKIVVHVNCLYNKNSQVPPLTQVPNDIPTSEKNVRLNCNAITSLDGRLDHLANLKYLIMGSNKLATFPDFSTFGGSLLKLGLNYNNITEVCPESLTPLKNLIWLMLAGNRIAVFPDVSPLRSTLERLTLAYNGITAIPARRLDPLVKLSDLFLHGNHLTTLPDVSALSATLSNYRLYDNPLEMVGLMTMQALNGITVDLRNAMFSSLPSVCYSKPTVLDIQGSALQLCACNNTWLKKAEEDCSLTLLVTDVTCPDAIKPWTKMTSGELADVCQPLVESGCHKGEILRGSQRSTITTQAERMIIEHICLGKIL